jgi:hypothetical protein
MARLYSVGRFVQIAQPRQRRFDQTEITFSVVIAILKYRGLTVLLMTVSRDAADDSEHLPHDMRFRVSWRKACAAAASVTGVSRRNRG